MKKAFISYVSVIIFIFSFIPRCFADFPGGFDITMEEFENDLYESAHWDKSSIHSFSWTGSDGKEYIRRSTGYQKEALSDSVDALVRELQDRGYSLDLSEGKNLFSSLPCSDMVKTALSEAGKPRSAESPPGSNRVFYNDWYYSGDVSGDSYPWSAVFISWCADSCGLISSGVFPKTASCRELYSHLTENCGFPSCEGRELFNHDKNPLISEGDILFLRRNGFFSSCGIISSVSGDSISAVIGDFRDRVRIVRFSQVNSGQSGLSDASIVHLKYPKFSFSSAFVSTGTLQDTCFLFLTKELGLSKAAACGVMGNFQTECNWNICAVGDGGSSYGLCQWHNERWSALRSFCSQRGLDSGSIEGQLSYLSYELSSTSESYVLDRLRNVPDTSAGASSAALIWAQDFERCTPDSYLLRQNLALQFFSSYMY